MFSYTFIDLELVFEFLPLLGLVGLVTGGALTGEWKDSTFIAIMHPSRNNIPFMCISDKINGFKGKCHQRKTKHNTYTDIESFKTIHIGC